MTNGYHTGHHRHRTFSSPQKALLDNADITMLCADVRAGAATVNMTKSASGRSWRLEGAHFNRAQPNLYHTAGCFCYVIHNKYPYFKEEFQSHLLLFAIRNHLNNIKQFSKCYHIYYFNWSFNFTRFRTLILLFSY